MAEQIHYCDKCGKIITPGEAAAGKALVSPESSFCVSCTASLQPEERARFTPPRMGASLPRRARSSTRHPKAAPPASFTIPRTIAIAGFGAGALLGVILTVLLASGEGDANGPNPIETPTFVAAPAVPSPPTPPPTPTPDDAESLVNSPTAPEQPPTPAPTEPAIAPPRQDPAPAPEPEPEPLPAPAPRPKPALEPNAKPKPQDAGGNVEPERLRKGLVGHWPFEETAGKKATDATGNGNDGSLSHVARFEPGSGRFGGGTVIHSGGAWQTDGVVCGNGSQLDVSSFTIAIWFKAASITTKSDWGNGIVCKWAYHERPQTGGWGLHLNHDGSVSLRLDGMNGPKSKPGTYTTGQWMHVAGAYDAAAKTATLLVNGAPVSSTKGTLKKPPASERIVFGRGDNWPHNFHGRMNDARLYNRVLSGAEVTTLMTWWSDELKRLAKAEGLKRARLERVAREKERLVAATTTDLVNDRYYLTPDIVQQFKGTYDKTKVTPGRLAVIGGTVAAQSSFQGGLRRRLTRPKGYSHAGSMGLVSRGATTDRIRRSAPRALAKEKPEVVRICFDVADLARKRPVSAIKTDLKAIVESARAVGAVPVLYTIPMRRPSADETRKLLEPFNAMVVSLAKETGVPLVDAYSALNVPDAREKRYFSSSGAVAKSGYAAVDDIFVDLYAKLERYAFGRGADPEPVAETPDAPAPRRDEADPAPVRPNAGNLVVNGSFERVREQTRFAANWVAKNRGTQGARSIQKLDRTNPHSGERAALLWALAAGAQPGMFTPLTLPAGEYRVSFWACAEVGKTAQLGAELGGRPLQTGTVPDEWTRFSSNVTVGAPKKDEDRPARTPKLKATLWFWSTATNTKVWVDDVVVESLR